jgi:hypothetical protein
MNGQQLDEVSAAIATIQLEITAAMKKVEKTDGTCPRYYSIPRHDKPR